MEANFVEKVKWTPRQRVKQCSSHTLEVILMEANFVEKIKCSDNQHLHF